MIAMLPERVSTDGMMAKKKTTPGRVNPREAGLQTLSVADIRQLIEDCRAELSDMDQTLVRAAETDVDAITLNGATKLARAMDLLSTFAGNLHAGLKQTIRQRGRP